MDRWGGSTTTDGVEILLASMRALSDALRDIIAEFEDAGSRTRELVGAIGSPQGDIADLRMPPRTSSRSGMTSARRSVATSKR
jgi:hypothetical protein